MAQYDLARLEQDLTRGSQVQGRARKIVHETAGEVRDSWRIRMRARRSMPTQIPHLPRAITLSMIGSPTEPEAEVGPDKRRKQGPLGNLLEFGARGRPPHNDGGDALDAHEELFVKRVGDLRERLL